jgi:hypothetical protein
MMRIALIAVAAMTLTVALVVGGIDIGRAGGSPEPLVPVLQAVGQAVTLIALAAILFALTAAPRQEAGTQPTGDLAESLARLRAAVEAMSHTKSDAPATLDQTVPTTGMEGASSGEDLRQILTLLRELRQLAMLNDSQRQELLASTARQRHEQLRTEIDRAVAKGAWGDADAALAAFIGEFPGDGELAALKARLNQERDRAAEPALRQLQERVEDLMAIGSWDRARTLTFQFVQNYPENRAAAQLLEKLEHDAEIARDAAVQRLYQEIKSDIDRRHWRRALAGAQKLMEQSPGHRRAAAIREQFATIAENAEIEQRQEMERHIQELLRAKQFAEAIDLAEQLLDRFPASPQAESLQQLLPKIRQLAIEHEVEFEPPA